MEIVQALLKSNAETKTADSTDWTPLESATFGGHIQIMQLLMKSELDAGVAAVNGRLLRLVALGGHAESILFLLQTDVSVDFAMEGGETSLIAAAKGGHLEVVRVLLKNRATVDKANDKSETSLFHAARQGHAKPSNYCLITVRMRT